MDLIAILSTVILLVTIGTIAVALAAYAALKLRDKRKPKPGRLKLDGQVTIIEPVFMQRYAPPSATAEPPAEAPQKPGH